MNMEISLQITDITNVQNVCIICLKECLLRSSFFGSKVAKMLSFLNFWEPRDNNNLLNQICQDCISRITTAYELKKLCIASTQYLESLISAESTENNLNLRNSSQLNYKIVANEGEMVAAKTDEIKVKCEDKTAAENMIIYLEFRCSYCDKTFESDVRLLEHDALCPQKNIEKQFGQFVNIDNVNVEVNTNENGQRQPKPQLACDKCNEKYSDRQDLKIHQSVHCSDMSCNQCEKHFPNMKALKRHIKIHMSVRDHWCKICDKGFIESGALAKHINKVHLGIPVKKKYECSECGKRFPDKYYLNIHIKTHTGERNIVCQECGKAFYDPRSMWVHMRSHRGEKNYHCNICSKSFSQSHSLHTHTRSAHTGEKLHCCEKCKKSFVLKSLLNKHNMEVHARQQLELDQINRALERAAQELVS